MSNEIENAISKHIENKKSQDGEHDIKLPGDTMTVARDADYRLKSFKDSFNSLKLRVEKDRSLLEEVKKAIEKATDDIIGK